MSETETTPPASEDRREDLYLESYSFTTAAQIIGSVDRKVFVYLRDERTIFGVLRTFDQFANLVIQDAVERICLPGKRYADEERDTYIIRGENVTMMGELDIDKEDQPMESFTRIPFKEAEREFKQIQHNIKLSQAKKQEILTKNGLVGDYIQDP
ncbi:unnamed protein product [Kuraishia capsulata CBS 1993]|uniref:U6 snRNA-associated Sm-like protein LSm1 n=1 Tax=Kuraishia capsulata CBS 1993 TaxID=1382522 RepID=W6MWR9_9ASCO|nr:uncharacterized protein KUCA_T00003774001 [Kuraishia capsulata CBS 1993]CDK27795.1 unnamed protein product [Kuraishia capsulata CBS 1993]